jgi:predicted enzyme related to lactoylglutathione lyase
VSDFESLPPGTFCWPELSTSDQKGAVAYYRALFGWDVNEQPIGPNEVYTMFQIRGRSVAAAYTMRDEERQHGVPPHWNSYVSVSSADEAVRRAQELGATVIAQPFDVMDAGRMAFLNDPTGATFAVWQPKQHIGTQIQNEPGALCWTELSTRDTKAAEKFYTQLFGWTAKHSSNDGMDYTEFSVQGRPGVGMMSMPPMVPPHVPPFWLPYFQVIDVDATAAKSRQLGGNVTVPPTDIPNTGRFAVLNDSSGSSFAVFTPKAG